MYSNLESKLPKLAIAICVCGTIFSIIYGVSLWSTSKLVTLLYILIGTILSWISSWMTYAIGEILSNQNHIMFLLNEMKSEPISDKLKNIDIGEGWLCECGARNTMNLERCNSCDAPRVDLRVRKNKLRNNDDRFR